MTETLHAHTLFLGGNIGWFATEGRGLGAVALKALAADTVIERNPVVIMPSAAMTGQDGEPLALDDYVFRWGPETIERVAAQCACALGTISLCNHSSTPNARVKQDHENRLMELIALRDINAGEEVTFDYDVELWFTPRG